jgi:hypothetical protein
VPNEPISDGYQYFPLILYKETYLGFHDRKGTLSADFIEKRYSIFDEAEFQCYTSQCLFKKQLLPGLYSLRMGERCSLKVLMQLRCPSRISES